MVRRQFLQQFSIAGSLLAASVIAGCRGTQHAHILEDDDENMVGSHEAGASVFEPLVRKAVVDLLAKESPGSIQQAGHNEKATYPKKICFCGIENASAEELGDFKEQIYEIIDQQIVEAQVFEPISRRFVEAGLREGRLRPDELFLPNNQPTFVAIMEQQGNPFDYLLFAKLTSGTTRSNGSDYQRDYLLTLELVNIHTGVAQKTSEKIRKGYHKSVLGKARHY
ncbi:MAG: penicillin-binding protein activator LpoB [Planctomycetota bacterium]|nr:penicillin-binding protein activator LpoB [Planctomycetota bacterium]MDA0918434.1 penicillin-binding protein activator LpoB [Planctomycetota bacterium]MDA1161045.1 penicillin-binding protein activator LpoB [Planctomycetota bacterium]